MEQISVRKDFVETRAFAEPVRSLIEVSVTTVIFTFDGIRLRVVGIADVDGTSHLTLPMHSYESGMKLEDVARLSVKHRCGLQLDRFYQVGAVSNGLSDLKTPSLDVCFFGVTSIESCKQLFENGRIVLSPVDQLEQFDSRSVGFVQQAFLELRKRTRFEDVGFYLLPQEFSLSELQKMFEAIMGRSIDVRNFRKKIESLGILQESPNRPKGMAYRPPRLFSFNMDRFDERLEADGEIRFF